MRGVCGGGGWFQLDEVLPTSSILEVDVHVRAQSDTLFLSSRVRRQISREKEMAKGYLL